MERLLRGEKRSAERHFKERLTLFMARIAPEGEAPRRNFSEERRSLRRE
jgi:hypothetical protein